MIRVSGITFSGTSRAAVMRLVRIKDDVLVNIERIAHIEVSTVHPEVAPPYVHNPNVHDYPVLTITMDDGTSYVIERRGYYPNQDMPFEPFFTLLNEITLGVG